MNGSRSGRPSSVSAYSTLEALQATLQLVETRGSFQDRHRHHRPLVSDLILQGRIKESREAPGRVVLPAQASSYSERSIFSARGSASTRKT
jgi:hypothetical protein